MAKERTTALVADRDGLQWITVRRIKDRFQAVGSGRIGAPAPSGEGAGGPAPALAEQLAGQGASIKGAVTLAVSSNQALLRMIRLPTATDSEVRGMVELQVDKLSPFPIEAMVVSHEIIEKREDGWLVLVAAVKTEVVDAFIARVKPAGVYPERVDVGVLGWWRLLREHGDIAAKGRHVIVLLHGDVPELIVCEDGLPILFRCLPERADMPSSLFAGETAAEVAYALTTLELEHGAGHSRQITLWSGAPQPELLTALTEATRCSVEAKSLGGLPTVAEGVARRTASPEGGVIDLTPPGWRQSDRARHHKIRLIALAAAIAGVWLLLAGSVLGGLYYQEVRLRSLRAQFDRVHREAMDVRNARRKVAMIKRYTDRNQSSLECLREIAALQAQGIDLTAFTYRKGEGVKISGESPTVDLVYDFKEKLDASRVFKGSSLQGPVTDVRRKKQTFDIDLKLSGGGGEP